MSGWMDEAKCREVDADLWFPQPGDTGQAAQAVRVCRDCPVKDKCLEWALRQPYNPEGVWGWHDNAAAAPYAEGSSMSRLRTLSLFSGAGGLDLAIDEVFGAETVYVADVCKVTDTSVGHYSPHRAPCSILAHRFPHATNLGDVSTVDWATLGPIDIVAGGSPCQDLSTAGRRAGMTEGTRSNLWVEMREAIAVLRPKFVVWENVRGAYSACADSAVDSELGRCPRCVDRESGSGHAPNLRALGRVLGDVSSLGYDAQWCGVRAADVGAPHGRFRVFILATDADRFGYERAGDARRRRFGPADGDREPVALLPTPGVAGGGASSTETVALLPTPRATDGTKGGPNQRGSSGDLMLPSAVTLLSTPTAMDSNASGGNPHTTGTHGKTLTDATVRQADRWGEYAPAIRRWEELTRPAPAPTEPTGKGGAQRLSPRFVEWLMGLPDGWITDIPGITRNEALKALGNGVVPAQAAAALRWLLSIEGGPS